VCSTIPGGAAYYEETKATTATVSAITEATHSAGFAFAAPTPKAAMALAARILIGNAEGSATAAAGSRLGGTPPGSLTRTAMGAAEKPSFAGNRRPAPDTIAAL
jgi:hypothetical protein